MSYNPPAAAVPLLALVGVCALGAAGARYHYARKGAHNGHCRERYRPSYHFTPPSGWMNDPNGLVVVDDEWHLFYQYYPYGNRWGPMHWGHAKSKDLFTWTHLPIALAPDDHGWIFSGSVVHDSTGTVSGRVPALVAIFTHHNPFTHQQAQSIASSVDHGATWHKYDANPVL